MMKGRIWVVVADGGAARFFECEKQGAGLVEHEELTLRAPPPEQPRDRPPRVHDRMGSARHSIEPRRLPRDAQEETFLRHVAGAVNAAAEQGVYRSLVLCAPPRPLGLLREHLSETALQCLGQVLIKDYVKASVEEIEAHLRAARDKG